MVLVMALAALGLMMVLLLALFAGTTNQTQAAGGDAAQAREKMLADSAVALVIGQIQQASTQLGQAWISQPGLLRTYAANAPRTPTACYKLYSTANLTSLIDQTGTLAFMSTDVPSNWSTLPAQYTDLNAPATTAGLFGETIYPILDPGAVTAVQGVSIDSGYGVQMPVAWLYELQDGTLGPASNGTAANPIVARIAFWTDDETSKININTAACGSPWNTPRFNSTNDLAWTTNQPAAGEYSAYPGHPATTSLTEVFPSLTPQQLLGMSPRYAWGGSEFDSQATTPGQTVTPKMDRLYASLDELCFSSSVSTSGQRVANPITTSQLNTARFVLTAHSVAPETTLLGEPRVAIWPVADTSTAQTATDRAVVAAATVGTGSANVRNYYFQRNNPLSTQDDFNPAPPQSAPTASNVQLFNDLVAHGQVIQPGYTAAFDSTLPGAKYPDLEWTQVMLEITDFIHCLNPIDPNSASPFAEGNAQNVGRGFIEPLTWTYGSGTNAIPLRGFGRCPTLSSLTLVFYVCGFKLKNGTVFDFDTMSDTTAQQDWQANFLPGSPQWQNVASELVRAFIVPCTFQPECGFPEVSDACTVQITNLTNLPLKSAGAGGNTSGTLAFTSPIISLPLGAPLTTLPADRAWGGNEGPAAWRQAVDEMMTSGTVNYPFASTINTASSPDSAFPIPIYSSVPTRLDPKTGNLYWPPANSFIFPGVNGLTVQISDLNKNVLQTFSVNLPAFGIPAPTINGECTQADPPPTSSTPETDWATNAKCIVPTWWYMCLRHRLSTSENSRSVMIQAGDTSRGIEAATDMRLMAGLSSVPSAMFQGHPILATTNNNQGGSHAHNLRFADGTSACFAPGNTDSTNPSTGSYGWNDLVASAQYPSAVQTLLVVPDWRGVTPSAYYNVFTSSPCSVLTGSTSVSMPITSTSPPTSLPGDWDTGPGYAPDGAQINMPDGGTILAPATAYQSLTGSQIPADTQRTPNALVPSPVILGSLPAGINPNDSLLAANNPSGTPQSQPWRTLLFCPYPAANSTSTPYAVHPGAASPPDYLILDNFWMPVVEPYAISTCMATTGKINLNDQIVPFTHLHRSTALRALLDDVLIPAVPVSAAGSYKSAGTALTSIWNPVDKDSTIAQIESRFANNSVDAYLSEGEICKVPLVPSLSVTPSPFSTNVTATQSALESFWNGSQTQNGGLTGDNLRELPYAQLYSRLTTRSNSYTVHVRVQVLKKLTSDPDQNVWKEGTDVVLGDWRGSYEIERYLDPAAAAPTARAPAVGSMLGPYKFRIVSAHAFAP